MNKVNIVFGACKRTLYFKRCIDSIKNQITYHDVTLVVDGPDNDPGVIDNINLFKDAFKHKYENIESRIFSSPINLGAEHNTIRSFQIGFETSDCDYLIFVEDDIEFDPLYLNQMELLWNFVKNHDEISTFSCYSRDCLHLSDDDLKKYENHLFTQYHHYGTGIKRKYYNDLLKSLMNEYLDNTEVNMINDSYKKIGSFYKQKYNLDCSEKVHWDIFYSTISYKFGYYRVTTCLNYCKHIGEEGYCCSPDVYKTIFSVLDNERFKGKRLIDNFIFDKKLNQYNNIIKQN